MSCIIESASLEPKFGNKIVAGGEDMWLHIFDFHSGDEIVHCVRFSPGGESYASGSEDGTIRIWQTSFDDNAAGFGSARIKVGVNEVVRKVEGFHITTIKDGMPEKDHTCIDYS